MKALILAAGRGTRISRYLAGKPKCTVNIGNISLIEYTVDLLRENGINDIAIVLGYNGGAIIDTLAERQSADPRLRYYYNPFFDVTNSIASAWFARDFIADEDMLVMNGDVYLDRQLLPEIISGKPGVSPLLYADETRREDADYKLFYTNGVLEKYGKELTGADITGEYIGLARMSAGYLPMFRETLDEMINSQQHGVWWENVLYTQSHRSEVYVEDIGGRFWAEVDYVEDYERILTHRGFTLRDIQSEEGEKQE